MRCNRFLAWTIVLAVPWGIANAQESSPKAKAAPAARLQKSGEKKEAQKAAAKDQSQAAQYRALLNEYTAARREVSKAYQKAKTQEQRQEIMKKQSPRAYAARFLKIAEIDPKSTSAYSSCSWIMTYDRSGAVNDSAREILINHHLENARLGSVCNSLVFTFSVEANEFLRSVYEKSPHESVRTQAGVALSKQTNYQARMAPNIKKNEKGIRASMGDKTVDYLLSVTVEELQAKAASIMNELVDKIEEPRTLMQVIEENAGTPAADKALTKLTSGGIDSDKLVPVVAQLGRTRKPSASVEGLLRKFVQADDETLKAASTAALGQFLKAKVDLGRQLSALSEEMLKSYKSFYGSLVDELRSADMEPYQAEAEKYLALAVEEYGEVELSGKTIKETVGPALFELRHLSVGKEAPDIVAEDLDGVEFKLSDYRGKVVLLDFWGNW